MGHMLSTRRLLPRLWIDTLETEWTLFCLYPNNKYLLETDATTNAPISPIGNTQIRTYTYNPIVPTYGDFLVGIILQGGKLPRVTVRVEVKDPKCSLSYFEEVTLFKHIPHALLIPWSLFVDIHSKERIEETDIHLVYAFLGNEDRETYKGHYSAYKLGGGFWISCPYQYKHKQDGYYTTKAVHKVISLLSPLDKARSRIEVYKEELIQRTWSPNRLSWVLDVQQQSTWAKRVG